MAHLPPGRPKSTVNAGLAWDHSMDGGRAADRPSRSSAMAGRQDHEPTPGRLPADVTGAAAASGARSPRAAPAAAAAAGAGSRSSFFFFNSAAPPQLYSLPPRVAVRT